MNDLKQGFKEMFAAIFIAALFGFFMVVIGGICQGQEVKRDGNTFSTTKVEKSKVQPTKTTYTWKDQDGQIYDIYITKNGRCFYYKTSKKTGNQYKVYLSKEICLQICKEMNIPYKEKKVS